MGKYIQVNEVALGKLRSLENVSCTCFYTDNLKLHQDLNHNCINLSSFPNKNTQTHKHTLNTPHFLSIHPFSCGAHARAHTYTHTRLCNSVASSPGVSQLRRGFRYSPRSASKAGWGRCCTRCRPSMSNREEAVPKEPLRALHRCSAACARVYLLCNICTLCCEKKRVTACAFRPVGST